ncbi:hypothetical protein [Niameybacter massiliensis]|uniref:hypothetical protein n=1 Tax=Niameybacter massiliensis TaxID=1658108 RepID=UPI0012B642F9|nr:hypothetical protein [Niameybacter massiliensis]
MKKYPVTENFLVLVDKALNGKELTEWQLKGVKGSARRYRKKVKEDSRKRVVYYNS